MIRRWVWWAAGGMLATACLMAVDYRAIQRHAKAGPAMFTAAGCAGPQAGGTATEVVHPSVGLPAWTTFQADASHNVVVPAPAAAGRVFATSWSFQTHGTVSTVPAVVGGAAYLGSMDGCVYALDVTTGALLWSFASNNQVMSEPLVVDGRVFFGTGNKGMGVTPAAELVRGTGASALYALDAKTGRQLWMTPTLGGNMPTTAYRDGILYDVGGGRTFYAVSAATGAVLWSLPIWSYVSMSSPTLVGDIAIFGSALPSALTGINVRTHEVAWSISLPSVPSGIDDVTPAAADGVAYVQAPEGAAFKRIVEMAVRASDGTVLWQRTLVTDLDNVLQRALGEGALAAHDGEEAGVATVAHGVLYVGSPALPGLWALDAQTGSPVWKRPAPVGPGIRTAPVVSGDRIYATDNTRLFVLDAATGRVLRTLRLGAFHERTGILIPCTTAGPMIVGDTLLVGTGDDAEAITAMPLEGLA